MHLCLAELTRQLEGVVWPEIQEMEAKLSKIHCTYQSINIKPQEKADHILNKLVVSTHFHKSIQ